MEIRYKMLVDKPEGNRPLGTMGIDEIIILKLCYVNKANKIQLTQVRIQWQAHEDMVSY
jgi:hypothetical protein